MVKSLVHRTIKFLNQKKLALLITCSIVKLAKNLIIFRVGGGALQNIGCGRGCMVLENW